MSVGPSAYLANNLLDAYGNADAFSVATPYIKLHIGDPGAAGTANAAGNTTRKSVSFGASASGVMSNDVAVAWTAGEVTTTEDYTFWSLWDASSAGNFLQSGTITSNSVTAGDTFTIGIGILDLGFIIAA